MKQFFAISFLFIFLLKMGGFYAYLSYQREGMRENIEQKIIKNLKKTDLNIFIANEENLAKIAWERKGKEFKFEGELYDIVFTEIKSGIPYYYCFKDKDETVLEAKINQFLKNQSGELPQNQHTKTILQLLLEPFTVHAIHDFHFDYFSIKNILDFPRYTFSVSSEYILKLTHPPQVL
jgi:hypothetical protein